MSFSDHQYFCLKVTSSYGGISINNESCCWLICFPARLILLHIPLFLCCLPMAAVQCSTSTTDCSMSQDNLFVEATPTNIVPLNSELWLLQWAHEKFAVWNIKPSSISLILLWSLLPVSHSKPVLHQVQQTSQVRPFFKIHTVALLPHFWSGKIIAVADLHSHQQAFLISLDWVRQNSLIAHQNWLLMSWCPCRVTWWWTLILCTPPSQSSMHFFSDQTQHCLWAYLPIWLCLGSDCGRFGQQISLVM